MLLRVHGDTLVLPREHRSDLPESADNKRSFGKTVQLPIFKPLFQNTRPYLLRGHGELHSNQEHFSPGHIQALCEQRKLSSAARALSSLQTSSSVDVYFALLRACNRYKDLHLLELVHGHLLQHQVDLLGPLGDYLVETLARYGFIEQALQGFQHLAHHSISTWNSVMSACNQFRQSEKTLELYAMMQENHVVPDCHTFVNLVKACSNLHNLQLGVQLHAEVCRKGVACDVCVSNSLINMYGKCGNILEAESVFRAMPEHNFASWTSMMLAYVDIDQGEKALLLYRQMLEENVPPNKYMLTIAIQACCILSENTKPKSASSGMICLEIGQALHADAQRSGVESNIFLSTALVHMYGKLGRLKEAENVFLSVSQLNISLCNSMLSAYLEHDLAEAMLHLYGHMLLHGSTPDQKTFVLAVQACGVLAEQEEAIVTEGGSIKVTSIELCQAVHADARKRGFASNVFLGTTLLGVYAKCGKIVEAEKVFGEFDGPDLVTWTAMIAAYVEQDQGELAMKLFRQMQEEGINANTQTFVVAIQACATLADKVAGNVGRACPLEIGIALHADAKKRGFDLNVFVGTALVGMYGICGDINKAESVFSTLPQRDLAAWNALLNAYVGQGHQERALQVYQKMLEDRIIPNQKTYVIVLQACGTLEERPTTKTLDSGILRNLVMELHDEICNRGFASDVFIGNTLVTVYGNMGSLVKAENAFDALCNCPVTSWNAMLSTYIQLNKGEKAVQLYSRMQDARIAVDDVTLVCVLQASSQTGNLSLCKQIHFSIVAAGYELNPSLASMLVHAYGNCGSMADAQTVFDEMHSPDIVSWNVCIAGYAGEGDHKSSIQMLERMQLLGNKPDAVTFTSVLSACGHGGFVTHGLEYFESLCKDSNILPDRRHFSSITDLLGRAGDLNSLESVLQKVPTLTDAGIWLSFLGACCVHGNAEIGKQAFTHALNLKSEEPSAFIMMSNLYSDFALHEFTDEDEDYD